MIIISSLFVGIASYLLIYLISKFKETKRTLISIYIVISLLLFASQYYFRYGEHSGLNRAAFFVANGSLLILGPLLFLFVKNFFKQESNNIREHWMQLIPFIMYSSGIIVFFNELSEPTYSIYTALACLTHLTFYLFYSLYIVIKKDAEHPENFEHEVATLASLVYLFLLFQCYFAILYGLFLYKNIKHQTILTIFWNDDARYQLDNINNGAYSLIILVFITVVLLGLSRLRKTKFRTKHLQ